jgi:ATP synthase protein I
MRETPKTLSGSSEPVLSQKIGAAADRKLRTKRRGVRDVWLGLGMFGLIGWSVAIPTLLGVLFGAFIDKHYPGIHSWTLSFLIIGLFLGCLNAWHWVVKEEKAIRKEEEEDDE